MCCDCGPQSALILFGEDYYIYTFTRAKPMIPFPMQVRSITSRGVGHHGPWRTHDRIVCKCMHVEAQFLQKILHKLHDDDSTRRLPAAAWGHGCPRVAYQLGVPVPGYASSYRATVWRGSTREHVAQQALSLYYVAPVHQ